MKGNYIKAATENLHQCFLGYDLKYISAQILLSHGDVSRMVFSCFPFLSAELFDAELEKCLVGIS